MNAAKASRAKEGGGGGKRTLREKTNDTNLMKQ